MQHAVSRVATHECTGHPWPEVTNSVLRYLTLIAPVSVDSGKRFGCCLLGSNTWDHVTIWKMVGFFFGWIKRNGKIWLNPNT